MGLGLCVHGRAPRRHWNSGRVCGQPGSLAKCYLLGETVHLPSRGSVANGRNDGRLHMNFLRRCKMAGKGRKDAVMMPNIIASECPTEYSSDRKKAANSTSRWMMFEIENDFIEFHAIRSRQGSTCSIITVIKFSIPCHSSTHALTEGRGIFKPANGGLFLKALALKI